MSRTMRNMLVSAAFGASLFTMGASAASAANIELIQDERGDVIVIQGELVDGDETAFEKIVRSVEDAVVVLDSPGGSLGPGLEIGWAIRDLGFDTLVMDGTECASACALAWLAGENRAMGDDAYVGFHAAYIEINNRPQEAGAANAIVGAYLFELGMSYDAIFALTSAPPDGMFWLTFAEAAELGIAVERFVMADAPNLDPNPDHPAKG